MRQLVVNADDMGMTRGINHAIVEAHRDGIVTSTSLIANGAAFDDAIEQLRQCPDLGVGLHVNVTQGLPLTGASSLADRRGRFHTLVGLTLRLSLGLVSRRELDAEIEAQAHRVAQAGIALSHFDSHENLHLHPMAAAAVARIAERMKVRFVRFKRQRPVLPWMLREGGLLCLRDHLRHWAALGGWHWAGDGSGIQDPRRYVVGTPQLLHASARQLFGALVRSMEDGITEWVCHPGYADDDLKSLLPGSRADNREAELKLLADPDCKARLDAAGIQLVNYKDVKL
jgi:predicted glycoside hydrolase/deacetylase ChbG (UPF0249 family)